MKCATPELSTIQEERFRAEWIGVQPGGDMIELLAAIMPRVLLQRGIGRSATRPAARRENGPAPTERAAPNSDVSASA